MDFAYILQIALLGLLALGGLIVVAAMLKAVPRPHKVKAYRYSKDGDSWILKYRKNVK